MLATWPRVVAVKMVRNGWTSLKVDPIGFTDRMDMGCERRSVEDDSKVWAWALEKWGCHEPDEQDSRMSKFEGTLAGWGGLGFGVVKFAMPIRHLSRDVIALGCREEVLAEINLFSSL